MRMGWAFIGAGVLSLSPVWTTAAAAAEPAKAALPSLTAREIVDRNLTARGGAAAWAAVHTMRISGMVDAGQERKDGGNVVTSLQQAKAHERSLAAQIFAGKAPVQTSKLIRLPYKLEVARPNRMRLEVSFGGQQAVQVFDGANGWKLRPFLGRHEVESFTPEELTLASDEQELDGPLVNFAAKGTEVVLEGTDTVEGRKAYRLRLKLKSGHVRHLWIDAQSFLEVKYEGAPRRFDGKMRATYTLYRNYAAENGLMLAHRLETVLEGVRQTHSIDIDKVAFNVDVGQKAFGKPM
ncbi:MAG: putative signal peptide protein [Gammaproteobacteria bacterium]|nr:putative signal peptide protein [Gammaproteobacteria bacterium]